MKVNVKNFGEVSVPEQSSIIDIIKMVNPEGLNNYCAARINNESTLIDLRTTVTSDCDIELLDTSNKECLSVLRHTTAHIMAEAVQNLFPEAKITIGPATDNGFFYDFDFRPFTREDLDAIEKEMKSIIKKATRLERKEVTRNEALQIMTERKEPTRWNCLRPFLRVRQSPSISRTISSTSAADLTCSTRAPSRASNCSRRPAPTGVETRRTSPSAAFMAQHSSPRRSWRVICNIWRTSRITTTTRLAANWKSSPRLTSSVRDCLC